MTAVDMTTTRNRIAKRSRRMRRAASRKLQRMAVQQEKERKKWQSAKLARERSIAAWNQQESKYLTTDDASLNGRPRRVHFATSLQVSQIPVAPESALPPPVAAPTGISLKPKLPPPDTSLSLRAARLYARYCANASIPDPANADIIDQSTSPSPYLSFTAQLLASLSDDPNRDDDDEEQDPDFALDPEDGHDDHDDDDHSKSTPHPLAVRTRSRLSRPKRIVPTKVFTVSTSSTTPTTGKRPRHRTDATPTAESVESAYTSSSSADSDAPLDDSESHLEEEDGLICEDSSERASACALKSSDPSTNSAPGGGQHSEIVDSISNPRPRKLRKISMSSSKPTDLALGKSMLDVLKNTSQSSSGEDAYVDGSPSVETQKETPVASSDRALAKSALHTSKKLSQPASSSDASVDGSSSVGVLKETPDDSIGSNAEKLSNGVSPKSAMTDSKSDQRCIVERGTFSPSPLSSPSGQQKKQGKKQGKEPATSPSRKNKTTKSPLKNGHREKSAPTTEVGNKEKVIKPKSDEAKKNGTKVRPDKAVDGKSDFLSVANATLSKAANGIGNGMTVEGGKEKASASENNSRMNGTADSSSDDDDGVDLDSIFAKVSKRKAQKSKILENGQIEKNGIKYKTKDGSYDIKASRKGGRRYTEEGYRIMTMDEIAADQPKGLHGECPFDCSCCF